MHYNTNKKLNTTRHAEKSLLSISSILKKQGGDPEQKHFRMTLFNGFTLIELLVVVLIIGILAAVALPQYNKAVAKARATQMISMVTSYTKALDLYVLQNGYKDITFVKYDPATDKVTFNDSLDVTFSEEEIKKTFGFYNGNATNSCFVQCYIAGELSSSAGCQVIMAGQKVDFSIWKDEGEQKWTGWCQGNNDSTDGEILCQELAKIY